MALRPPAGTRRQRARPGAGARGERERPAPPSRAGLRRGAGLGRAAPPAPAPRTPRGRPARPAPPPPGPGPGPSPPASPRPGTGGCARRRWRVPAGLGGRVGGGGQPSGPPVPGGGAWGGGQVPRLWLPAQALAAGLTANPPRPPSFRACARRGPPLGARLAVASRSGEGAAASSYRKARSGPRGRPRRERGRRSELSSDLRAKVCGEGSPLPASGSGPGFSRVPRSPVGRSAHAWFGCWAQAVPCTGGAIPRSWSRSLKRSRCWGAESSNLPSISVANRPGRARVRQSPALKNVLRVLRVNRIKILVPWGLVKPLFCLTSAPSNVAEAR